MVRPLAEQTEPVRRKVAIKIIKRGMDTLQVIARFEAGHQALQEPPSPAASAASNHAQHLDGTNDWLELSPIDCNKCSPTGRPDGWMVNGSVERKQRTRNLL